jgi:hypothetical protein
VAAADAGGPPRWCRHNRCRRCSPRRSSPVPASSRARGAGPAGRAAQRHGGARHPAVGQAPRVPAHHRLPVARPPRRPPAARRRPRRRGPGGARVKLGRYLDELPPRSLEVADARGFPVVQLPDGVSFDEIFNEVLTGILNRQAQKLARSERIHRAFLQLVLRGHGVVEIARDLAELVDAPAAVVDLDGAVLGAARLEEVPAFAEEVPDRLVVAPDGTGSSPATSRSTPSRSPSSRARGSTGTSSRWRPPAAGPTTCSRSRTRPPSPRWRSRNGWRSRRSRASTSPTSCTTCCARSTTSTTSGGARRASGGTSTGG